MSFPRFVLSALALASLCAAAQAAELVGYASMPADTFAKGPTAGQFVSSANGRTLPLVDKQAVQGFSAVLPGPVAGTYRVMPDNGFGNKANSPDAMLRTYTLQPNFRSWDGAALVGEGNVVPVNEKTGAVVAAFTDETFTALKDPDGLIGFTKVADREFYPYSGSGPGAANIPVPQKVRDGGYLTGSDLDIESMRRDKNGYFWFGDEFGPFLVKTNKNGKVLRAAIPMAGVQSPDNPFLNGAQPTLNGSNGFEGMAINAAGDHLYTLLEGSVVGDTPKTLRINEFSVDDEAYTGRQWHYKLDDAGTNIGDMTAVNAHQFIVLERNGTQDPRFKRVFLIDLNVVDADGNVQKTEIADLMNLADPHDLNQDSSQTFTFPWVTIEDVLVLDASTLLIINDNNYPGSSKTAGVPDITEFLQVKLDQKLALKDKTPLN
ncbi:esterase-like activity of phytase family protein [Ideonella azotifigens]|uniref:Esterase-like activity of phytase family protein n=1 Tax=Ideonella azotifigens TaxID=513160 RepID=A0ABP3VZ33_9BURK|nr:esterase-like activity of phytase family protein [Ideonella azotifigens]MCD2343379.1 esterase-like activity of phytase family protein [Ideonella azotifigens]